MDIKPSFSADDVYEGGSFKITPDGTYKMAISGQPMVAKTQSGNAKLTMFLKHTETKGLSGVKASIVITGKDKNGKDNAARLGQLFLALGVAKEDLVSGTAAVSVSYDEAALESADWKGVPATLTINGDSISAESLAERNMLVSTETTVVNGKASARAKSFYPLKD